jgi:amidase
MIAAQAASPLPAPSDIVLMDGAALSVAIKSRQVSCVEVMNAYLDHIDRLNPKVNAIVSLQPRDGLLAQARVRDAELVRGEWLGWMHGFPHAVKDLTPVKGLPFTRGSVIFKDCIAPADAIVVERIKAAGAIIIGKTNTPEFGLGSQTHNPVFGTTVNPYDLGKTSGGSSGGAGAALALRMLPVADGTDHGGSLRNPGAFNNVFGFRTSYGRVPAEAPDAFNSAMGVGGPMARTVTDLARLLSVQAGYDARAPLSIRQDRAQFANPLRGDVKGKRIAWGGDLGGLIPVEPGILDLGRGALKVFETLGCHVEEAVPDFPLDQIFSNWTVLRAWQAGGAILDLYRDPGKRALLKEEARFEVESLLGLGATDIVAAATFRTSWYQTMRKFFERYDYFVLPSAQVFPFDANMHWPKQIAGRTMDTYHRWMEIMIPATMAGAPALNVPAGFNDKGLPMGIQIVGPNHAEANCLELAFAYDQATRWVEQRPPPLLAMKPW